MRFSTTDDRTHNDLLLRRAKTARLMRESGIEAALFTHPTHLFYYTGRVTHGYFYLTSDGKARLFVRRPSGLEGDGVAFIKHPAQIPELLGEGPRTLALEDDVLPHAEYVYLAGLFPKAAAVDGAMLCMRSRAVKTPLEIEAIRACGERQARGFRLITDLYRPGMTDLELAVDLERELRLLGHMGLFRTYGFRLEAHLGLVLAGGNAAEPSPYDFSLGGAGLHPGFPGGPSGVTLSPGIAVMVDYCFVHRGYQSDMSRAFFIGQPTKEALDAHDTCVTIERAVADAARPGAKCADLYELAMGIAASRGYADRFMGLAQQAKFVGHSIGIEVNESPVFAARMEALVEENMVFAIEPKIVLSGVGAVGVEDTYLITANGAECLTAPCASGLTAL